MLPVASLFTFKLSGGGDSQSPRHYDKSDSLSNAQTLIHLTQPNTTPLTTIRQTKDIRPVG